MSVVPFTYDFHREIENFKKSMFFDDFLWDPFSLDFFKRTSILPLSIFNPFFLSNPLQYFHDIHKLIGLPNDNAKMTIDKNGFQLTFDTKDFKPNELTVKTINNFVIVEGKHEERKDDHNFTKKHFTRTYLLPNGYNPEEVISDISSDGILSVKIPPPPPQRSIESKERIVRIKETGQIHSDSKALSVI